MTITLIEIGKHPEEPLHAGIMLHLPTETPYGNFTLKWVDMMTRLDEANKQIVSSHEHWEATRYGNIEDSLQGMFNRHRFATEYAVTGMRRVADELIALIWCLERQKLDGEYPQHVKPDDIGAMFKIQYEGPDGILKPHEDLLRLLNDLSNALKHSFIQSDLIRTGSDEVTVIAQNMFRANRKHPLTSFEVTLNYLTSQYNLFFHDCRKWLTQHCQIQQNQD